MLRKPIGKRLRFEIFKRDGFRCTYCGATPVDRPLHVDHVKAVAEGGTDDPFNLVTACDACNLGKSKVPLEKKRLAVGKLTEADLDHAEQIREYLAVQRDVANARSALQEQLIEEWEHRCGEASAQLRGRVVGMVTEFGIERLLEAFDIVAAKELRYQNAQLKYLHGVLRRWREGAAPVEPAKRRELPRVVRAREAVHAACGEVGAEGFEGSIAGHICAAFARACGASGKDVEGYYGSQRAMREILDGSESIEIHGVRLRTMPAGTNQVRWIVEQVDGYDAFREAYESLADEIHNTISYAISYGEYLKSEGKAQRPGELEENARDLLEKHNEIGEWIKRHKKEDLGEGGDD